MLEADLLERRLGVGRGEHLLVAVDRQKPLGEARPDARQVRIVLGDLVLADVTAHLVPRRHREHRLHGEDRVEPVGEVGTGGRVEACAVFGDPVVPEHRGPCGRAAVEDLGRIARDEATGLIEDAARADAVSAADADGERKSVARPETGVVAGRAGDVAVAAELAVEEERLAELHLGVVEGENLTGVQLRHAGRVDLLAQEVVRGVVSTLVGGDDVGLAVIDGGVVVRLVAVSLSAASEELDGEESRKKGGRAHEKILVRFDSGRDCRSRARSFGAEFCGFADARPWELATFAATKRGIRATL